MTIHPFQAIPRLWSRVDQSGDCWMWTGYRNPQGYGKASFQGKSRFVHRLAYFLTYGAIPEGMYVCHTCDNPPCCNPAHLWVGTALDNTRDRDRKGRDKGRENIKKARASIVNGSGERHYKAKLTEENIIEVRQLRATGFTFVEISRRYGVHESTIGKIFSGRSWRSVAEEVSK